MKYLVLLPSAYQPYTDECVASMAPELREHLELVDNTVVNKMVQPSWNIGVRKVIDQKLNWLILLSAAIRFGEPGGMDFVKALEEHAGHTVLEAMPVFGWHFIAFSRECLELVGEFDENFPIYFGDIDYSLRIQKAYNVDGRQAQLWDKAEVDVQDMGMAHGIKHAGIVDPAEPRIEYFKRKWGIHPGAYQLEAYATPFDNPNNSISYWPKPESIGAI